MDKIMVENSKEFILNPLFDSRYNNIIIASDDLKEWFRVNQDILVSIKCTNLKSAREILENENQDILNNKLIQEFATIAENIFKVFDNYVDKKLDSSRLSCVAYNVMDSINNMHKSFGNYKPHQGEIRKYDFNMIVEILNAVYNADKYNIRYESQTTSWNGSISDNLVFSVESHTMQNGFEDPDWSVVLLKLENDILKIHTLYENRVPKNPDDVIVQGATSDLVEKIYNEVNISKNKIYEKSL